MHEQPQGTWRRMNCMGMYLESDIALREALRLSGIQKNGPSKNQIRAFEN